MSMQDNGMIAENTFVADAPAMRGPRHDRNDMISAFTEAVRDNPLPAALIGMGALWLFAGGGSMTLFGGRGRSSLLGTVAHGAGTVAHGAGDVAQTAAQSVGRMGHSVASGVSSAVGGFAEAVSDTAGRVGEYVGSSLHGVDAQSAYRNPRFDGIREDRGMRASMGGMTSSLQHMLERHPLALGMAGLALGAGIAATLPVTAAERDTLGKANEAMRSRLGEAADQAKDMASAVVEEVRGTSGHGPG